MSRAPSQHQSDWLRWCLVVLAVGYALLAGLHTVYDLDLGWQLATGRYLVEHHQIPRTELFSYTAQGTEWIYPPFSGAIFYLLYLAGGYSALSWLGALACAGTTALVVASGGRLAAALAIVAVPAIAFRTMPRAELFTTLLFAAVLGIVWTRYRGKKASLWLLPILFFVWPNLHLGFISGLGLLGAAIFLELCDLPFTDRRAAAVTRLQKLAPWIAVSFVATLLNPWGWRIYQAILRQNKVMALHSAIIGEWTAVHFNSLAWIQALNPRDPASADWWLLAVGALSIAAALWLKRFGPAAVLAAGMYLSIEHIRLQTLFAVLVVVIGGTLLSDAATQLRSARSSVVSNGTGAGAGNGAKIPGALSVRWAIVCAALFLAFTGLRAADLVTDRYYLDSSQIALFGTGASWWYPERAAAFLEREGLPRNVFHDYNLGGYLAWRIGPLYPDFVDGRYIPFGDDRFSEQKLLASVGPDTPEWQQASARWQINTAIFSVARYAGLGTFALQDFCASKSWTPVYLDDVSIVFVRNRPESSELIRKFGLSCDSAPIAAPPAASGNSYRARAERFNYLMNVASIDFLLARDAEALIALGQAEQISPDNPNLHLVKAQMFAATGRASDAEREYLIVLRDHPSDAAWFALARLYSSQRRYPEALRAVDEAVSLSIAPYERLRAKGLVYLAMNQPQGALQSFDDAEAASPYARQAAPSNLGKQFDARLAEGRARAYRQLNQLALAVAQQKLATTLTPDDPSCWTALADLYDDAGQRADSSEARLRAEAIRSESAKPPKMLEAPGKP